MISKLDVFSCKRTSKSRIGGPPEQQGTSRYSMLKMRLGAVPDTEVNIPWPLAASKLDRSSQYGKIAKLNSGFGKQVGLASLEALRNWKVPLESTLTVLPAPKVWP